jgi:hypothetical protein
VLAGHRAFGSLLIAGPGEHPAASYRPGAAVMPLRDHATLVTALAADGITLRETLDTVLETSR